MKYIGKVTIIKLLDEKTGSNQNGNWTKGDYLVKDAFSGNQFCVTAWNQQKNDCDNNIGLLIDCTIEIKSREYNGKFYNDVSIFNVKNMNIENAIIQQPMQATNEPTINPDNVPIESFKDKNWNEPNVNDLPF